MKRLHLKSTASVMRTVAMAKVKDSCPPDKSTTTYNVQQSTEFNVEENDANTGLVYNVNETPPWYMCIVLGLQHYITMIGGTVSIFFVVANSVCVDSNLVLKAELLGTVFFAMGISTLLQTIIGIRLPIIQGCSAALILPVVSMAKNIGTCPTLTGNNTMENFTNVVILPRLQLVSGTLMVSSLFQILIGLSGIISFLLRFIGPLVIAPTITLIGLSLFEAAAIRAEGQWWIALTTSLLICIFTYYLSRLRVPCCVYHRGEGCRMKFYQIFKTCPVILGIAVSWALCGILTATNALPNDPKAWGYSARTDAQSAVLTATPWLQFPYPGRWGRPTLSAAALLGLLAGVLTSIIESIGDYFACARMAGAPPPPAFAVNRGIALEGFGGLIAASLSLPNGTTSYSENVAAIGITRVGSRRVVQVAAVFMLIFGIVTKIGAIFVSIPDPIYGGVFLTMFGKS